MKVLLAPTERALAEALADDAIISSIPEEKGADILIYSIEGLLGIQRKEVPHDFLSSVIDGRMARETSLLAECCQFRVVLGEGAFRYFPDGSVATGVPKGVKAFQRFTESSIRKIIFDIKLIKGVDVDFTKDLADTIKYIKTAHEYLTGTKHVGLFQRPKAQGAWGSPTSRELHSWILQGFPGVGPGLADAILRHFKRMPIRWDCSYNDLLKVSKIGAGRARKLWLTLQD